MKWSFKLGSIKGIQIRVHSTFFLIVLWGAFNYGSSNDVAGLAYGAAITLLLFGIVLLHELGHSMAARYFDIEVRDITLLPIGGVARLEEMPSKPLQEFIVAIAGPAVNVLIAFLIFPILIWAVDGAAYRLLYFNLAVMNWLNVLIFLFMVNVSLLIFNMIPAFPLDGGRVLRSLLAMKLGVPKATRVAVRIGQVFAVLMGFWGIYSGNFMLALIALFIFTAGGAEGKVSVIKGALDSISARQVVSGGGMILQPTYTVMEVASLTMHNAQHQFPVMLGDALIGVIRRSDVRDALQRGQRFAALAEIMLKKFPQLEMDDTLTEVQLQLVQSNSPVAAIFDGPRFVGLIGFDDIEAAYRIYSSSGRVSHVPA